MVPKTPGSCRLTDRAADRSADTADAEGPIPNGPTIGAAGPNRGVGRGRRRW